MKKVNISITCNCGAVINSEVPIPEAALTNLIEPEDPAILKSLEICGLTIEKIMKLKAFYISQTGKDIE